MLPAFSLLRVSGPSPGPSLVISARIPDTSEKIHGFREDRWFGGVYLGDHLRYAAIMQERYGDGPSRRREVARRAAHRQVESRRLVDYVLQEPEIDERRIGVLSEGFPLWVRETGVRVDELPEALREAIVVDPTGVVGPGTRFVPELVRQHSAQLIGTERRERRRRDEHGERHAADHHRHVDDRASKETRRAPEADFAAE